MNKNTTDKAAIPRPSGNPWVLNNHDPATVPVPIPVIMVKVNGSFKERERKLWTFLLHAVWDEIEKDRVHRLPIQSISKVFRDLGGEHDSKWIEECLNSIIETKVEFLEKDKITKAHLISAAKIERKDNGYIYFEFPQLLIDILKEPMKFARLRTHFLISLSGKYSVTLYELLESVANLREPVLEASIEQLRSWLKVQDGILQRWDHFHNRVIKTSVKEINSNPIGSGFTVAYKILRQGKKVTGVSFKVTKTPNRLNFEKEISHPSKEECPIYISPQFRTEVYERAKKIAPRFDVYALEAEWREWAQATNTPIEKPERAFLGFCKSKAKKQLALPL